MKRIQDRTIRQRTRALNVVWGLPMVFGVIVGMVFQQWFILGAAIVDFASLALFFFANERNTRDDPPHGNY